MTKKLSGPNLQRIDLNLLRVFEAVFEERNLLRAGKRLHLSQSAISHALGRLRESLQDELFVRTSKGMEPTARALAIAAPLRDAMQGIRQTLGVMPFDPQTETRTFVLAANDYVTAVLAPALSHHLMAVAPSIDLVIRPSTRLDLAEQIDLGRIDLAIGIFSDVPSRFQSAAVWSQQDALVMRKGHPLRRKKLSVGDLVGFPMLIVSLGGQEEGAVSGYILEHGLARQSEMFDRQALEDALRAVGRKPRYRMTVPHSLAVPDLLAASDMVSIVPEPLARAFSARAEVAVIPLPYTAPVATLRALWHRRHEHDPAHIWLRRQILDLGSRPRSSPG